MPSEHPHSHPADVVLPSDDALQTKRCSACHRPLNADATPTGPYPPGSSETANFCSACREARLTRYVAVAPVQDLDDGVCERDRENDASRHTQRRIGSLSVQDDGLHTVESLSDSEGDDEVRRRERDGFVPDNSRLLATTGMHATLPISISFTAPQHPREHSPLRISQHSSPDQAYSPTSSSNSSFSSSSSEWDDGYPDPLVDITRLRVRSKGYKCLYPGATFKGSQKSGRNSYDVNVTIVDVDFASSYLCGYLRIRGLTEDWPELTTYFDAQIIGMRHGFDTQDWGATRQEDMVHWARFPAFRAVQKDLIEPRLTLPANTSRPAVFMRWKERFLVPDHRVQDISGASFAGFYYVCVDFDPQSQTPPISTQNTSQDIPICVDNGFAPSSARSQRQDADAKRWKPVEEPKALMRGFYFHQNSEPYQQLSLTHVKDRFHSTFEFR
ncbi:hypothetical protein M0805_002731 [Coniferiporia weirii]|nr:hypothetical protein M0805_002731 [Coniferiporia weirii]